MLRVLWGLWWRMKPRRWSEEMGNMQSDPVSMPQLTLSPRKLEIQQSEFTAAKKISMIFQELIYSTTTFNNGLRGFLMWETIRIQAMIFHCQNGIIIIFFKSLFTGHSVWKCMQYDQFKDCVVMVCLHRYQQMMQTLKNSMSLVVESLLNKCEEDQRKKEGSVHDKQYMQFSSQYNCNDNCSDSDSSFNQVKFVFYYTQHLSDGVNLICFHWLVSCFILSLPECCLH